MTTQELTLTDAIPAAEKWTVEARERAQIAIDVANNLLAVKDAESAEQAGEFINEAGRLSAQVEAMRKSVKQPVLDAARAIDAQFKPVVDMYNQSLGIAKRKLSAYHTEQRRIEEERLAEQRRAAEAERKKLEAQARRAEKRGNEEKAEEARMLAAMTPEPVRSAPERPSNVTLREEWDFEVESMPQLVAAVAQGKVPMEALQPNHQFIRRNVKAQRTAFSWAGIRAFVTTNVARRAS